MLADILDEMLGNYLITAVHHIEQIGRRRREDADEGAELVVEVNDRVGALDTERNIGHVTQTHDVAILGLERQFNKDLRRL